MAMTLRSVFAVLFAEATARQREATPGTAYKALRGGADIRVLRVLGQRRQIILGRRGAPVGETEIATFRRDANVPDDATRRDYINRQGWHRVALSWAAPAPMFPEDTLPPL
jgi:hypothetical protein